MIAIDMRGHGYSSKPDTSESYVESDRWAEDINAVAQAKGLNNFTLVGWSYAGVVLLDYVQKYGQEKLSGLVFVATAFAFDGRAPEDGGPEMVFGDAVLENLAPMGGIPTGAPGEDADGCEANNTCGEYDRQFAATKRFVDAVPAKLLPQIFADEALAYNMQTPTYVRRAMIFDRMAERPINHLSTLETLSVPTLFIHGEKDIHVLPRSTEIMQSHTTKAHVNRIVYPNVAHAPFLENPNKFNADLAEFVK